MPRLQVKKSDSMTANAMLFAIGERVKELANLPIDQLRMIVGMEDTPYQNIKANKHRNRGSIIEEIITEEFEGTSLEIDNGEFD